LETFSPHFQLDFEGGWGRRGEEGEGAILY